LLAAVRLRLLSRRIGWLLIAEILLTLRRLALHRLTLRSLTRVVVVVEGIVTVAFARRRRRLVEGVLLPELLLRRRDQAGIVLGVLKVVLGGDWIAGRLGVAGELKIFLGNVVCRSSDLHLWAIRLIDPCQWIVMVMPAATAAVVALIVAVTSSHALVLSVSHDSPVAGSRCGGYSPPIRSSKNFKPHSAVGHACRLDDDQVGTQCHDTEFHCVGCSIP